ncbi:MAG: phosphate signaling complex protein PhoU [Microbacteriaceae bacterium]|nr:phosphate signaling complex protein PhoU [Microbacteriaceae bacterium]
MREVFQQELSEVQDRLVTIASEATETMKLATQAFLTSDVALADQALEKADANEAHALDLDELVIKVLATQGPVAKDLRILVSALRMSASLERMGGLAGHIAAIARFRYPGSAIPEVVRPVFEKMSELDVALGERCVELLKNTSLDEATQIADADDEVDKLHKQVFDIVLADDWKENAMFTVDVTLASRYFERFADHVVDISDKVRYLNTGDWTEN